ncbi:MAG: metallophosphoesterase family protein [Candidatus Hodarchaeota archaeon]
MDYYLVHLSDIHVGEGGFASKKAATCIKEVNDFSPDLVVITGDLTEKGLLEEFEGVSELVKEINSRTIYLMGNHDARNVGFMHFQRLFGDLNSEFTDKNISFLALDSSEPDLDVGHIGREYYPQINRFFTDASSEIKIFALHHHLIPMPLSGRERDIVMDAGDVLKMLTEMSVTITICGHKHVPFVWQVNNMIICSSGTVGSPRTRGIGTQSYVIHHFTDERIEIKLKLIGKAGRTIATFQRIADGSVRRTKQE